MASPSGRNRQEQPQTPTTVVTGAEGSPRTPEGRAIPLRRTPPRIIRRTATGEEVEPGPNNSTLEDDIGMDIRRDYEADEDVEAPQDTLPPLGAFEPMDISTPRMLTNAFLVVPVEMNTQSISFTTPIQPILNSPFQSVPARRAPNQRVLQVQQMQRAREQARRNMRRRTQSDQVRRMYRNDDQDVYGQQEDLLRSF